jgi:hypothetical protein
LMNNSKHATGPISYLFMFPKFVLKAGHGPHSIWFYFLFGDSTARCSICYPVSIEKLKLLGVIN